MDTLWSPCSRSASAAWLLVGSRWSSELFEEQVIFLESVVVDPLQAEAAAEDPVEWAPDLCQSPWRLQVQKKRRLQESMRAARASLKAAGPPCRSSKPFSSENGRKV